MDWAKITKKPLEQSIAKIVRGHLKGISNIYNGEKISYFCDVAKGKNCIFVSTDMMKNM